jgi:excisionase family DNA binding protein
MVAPTSDGDSDLDALDIPEICRRTRLGRSYIYEAIRAGELRAIKLGRLTRVLRVDYMRWLTGAPPITPKIQHDIAPPLAPITRRGVRPGAPR